MHHFHASPQGTSRQGRVLEIGWHTGRKGNPHIVVERKKVVLVEPDEQLRTMMGRQIGYFGFDVQTLSSVDSLTSLEEAPGVLVVSLGDDEGHTAMAISEIKDRWDVPALLLSVQGDFEARLRAVRIGGDAFLQKPVPIHQIIDELDQLTEDSTESPGRVLFIENGNPFTEIYSTTLRQMGFVVKQLFEPDGIDTVLQEFEPDLIILNLYYPECLGMEMAALLRQNQSTVSIPIVFLSREQNLSRHLAAIHKGGDDFFVHPVDPEHLATSIHARINRTRILKNLMVRDAMTGLLNHSAFNERFEAMLRQNNNGDLLALAMIDIDNFKHINDTHGHAAGDQAIRNLSRALKQSVRKEDLVGRFGGEEFVVLLPVKEPIEAYRVMDQIRQMFSRILHTHAEESFYCTFSCGIAIHPDFPTAGELVETADEGLYIAKDKGRNCVIMIQRRDGSLLVFNDQSHKLDI